MIAKNLDTNTESIIRKAAMKVFLEKGLAGARLQEIADEAGISRTSLHYYYRSKEKLFQLIFSEALAEMRQRVESISRSDVPVLQKIERFITNYIENASQEFNFDMFFINEFNQNPELFREVIKEQRTVETVQLFMNEIKEAARKGEIVGDPEQVFLNLISMSIFPFAAKSLVMNFMQISETHYSQMIERRKEELVRFVMRAITP
jgi:TetR/AcrR family transcriptional regulator